MNEELLEICQSIHETMENAEHDLNKIYNMDLRFKDSVEAEIIHQRDEILKSLIAELLQVHEKLSKKNP